MRQSTVVATLLLLAGCSGLDRLAEPAAPKNFIYFGRDRERVQEPEFLNHPTVAGAQLKYTWPELEPERGVYNIQLILDDLAVLRERGKELFIQIQDVSFEESIINVPAYLLSDPLFSGGVARQYSSYGGEPVAEGWVARRWDPAVRERFASLLDALGQELDGRIAGVSLPETSVGFGRLPELIPAGFTPESFRDGVIEIMSSARRAFPTSDVIQYANFMSGEELPDDDRGYLRSIYAHADSIGVGVGGPDLLAFRWFQWQNSYPLIASRGSNTVAGVAVQWGNLAQVNPATDDTVTVDDTYRVALDSLHLDYIFWGVQEPYYSRDILPYLERLLPD